MGGIAGCYGSRDEKTINRMLDALGQRGPHDRRIHSTNKMVWGHSRSVTAEEECVQQPILNEDTSKGVIASGEIYNFQALRERFATRYPFKTHTDAEVILALYEQRGPDGVRDLDGMFVFALFDTKRDTFMLARDAIGIKPLYYGSRDGTIYFTSDIAALKLAGVDEVHEFPAGHYYTPADGFIRYYRVPAVDKRPLLNAASIGVRIRQILTRAVKKRVAPQGPVGVFASGDLASAIVAALAAREIPHLHTFAVALADGDGNDCPELLAAQRLAAHIGASHHELAVSTELYEQALHRVIHQLKSYEPSLIRPAVPCYLTSKLAAGHVSVVLTGAGADELFAGYRYMQQFSLAQVNEECRRCIGDIHTVNGQWAARLASSFNLDMRLPFLDKEMISLAMKISAGLKIKELDNGAKISKWIFRQAFVDSGLVPDEVLRHPKGHSPQTSGWEKIGAAWADRVIDQEELSRLKDDHPGANIESKEAALYFKIFRQGQP